MNMENLQLGAGLLLMSKLRVKCDNESLSQGRLLNIRCSSGPGEKKA